MQGVEPYGNQRFWDERYKRTGALDDDELYVEYDDLEQVFGLYFHEQDKSSKILHIGCGLSNLAQGLWKQVGSLLTWKWSSTNLNNALSRHTNFNIDYQGWTNVTNVDLCQTAVDKCRERDKHLHGVQYLRMDCTEMSAFPDSSFDFVIEKGLIDSLFCSMGCVRKVRAVLSEVSRVLRPGGYFLSVSSVPKHCRFPHLVRPEFEWRVDQLRLAADPGYFMYSCRKRSFHKEWFFGDPGALQLADDSKREYVPPLKAKASA